jgi:hypothetical protein
MAELSIEQILEEYGRYYEQAGQNLSRLKRAFMQPSETLQYATSIPTNDTIFKLANPLFQPVLQAFQRGFTPRGGVKFVPNPIELHPIKIDYKFYPTDIEGSWLGFLDGDSSRTIEKWPIVKYMLEEYLMNQAIEDKELNGVYKGIWQEPQEGVAGLSMNSMDGLKKALKKGAEHEDCRVNVIEGMGELDETSIFDQLEFYDNKISELYNGKKLIHFVAQKWVRAFKTAKRANGYYFIDSASKINAEIDFTDRIVVGLPSMNGTKDIFTTMKSNMLHLRKRDLNRVYVDIQKQDREVKFLIHWWEATGFACNAMVWTSKESLTPVTPVSEPETDPEEPETIEQP